LATLNGLKNRQALDISVRLVAWRQAAKKLREAVGNYIGIVVSPFVNAVPEIDIAVVLRLFRDSHNLL
jgi:hypothetical protein